MHRTGVLVEYGEFIHNWQTSGKQAPVSEDESGWLTPAQAENMALNFVSTNGSTLAHISGESEVGRFFQFEVLTNQNPPFRFVKVIVDRKQSLVGNDYSHY